MELRHHVHWHFRYVLGNPFQHRIGAALDVIGHHQVTDAPHFHWAKSGEYVSQVTAIGPLGLEYLDPRDDPRNKCSKEVTAGLTNTGDAIYPFPPSLP